MQGDVITFFIQEYLNWLLPLRSETLSIYALDEHCLYVWKKQGTFQGKGQRTKLVTYLWHSRNLW